MRSDFFRICFLLIKGGVYIDADERCLQPADSFFAGWEHVRFAACVSPDIPFYVHNSFIYAAPGHGILSTAFDLMIAAIRNDQRARRKTNIWYRTGPGLITRSVAQYLARSPQPATSGDVTLISEYSFRQFAETPKLNYKRAPEGNWRLA